VVTKPGGELEKLDGNHCPSSCPHLVHMSDDELKSSQCVKLWTIAVVQVSFSVRTCSQKAS